MGRLICTAKTWANGQKRLSPLLTPTTGKHWNAHGKSDKKSENGRLPH
jgi:hypothetical protein